MKMRYKLFGILVVLFFMGIVAITVYLNLREGRQYLDTEISSRVKIAEAIIRTWHAVMLFTGSDTLAREQFLNVQTENGLLSIKLARNENLTRINPGSSPYVSTELEKQVITEGKPAFEILAKNSHSDRRLLTLVPIKAQPACIQCHQEVSHHHIKEGEVMAVISLITSLKVVDSQIASDRAATAFSLLGIFLVTLAISFLAVKRFTRPITKLTQASEAIAAGEFEVRVPTTSKGELGILENAFNLMVKRVKESKEALEAYSERLEEEVAERTQALQSALKESRQRQTEISALLEGSRTVLDTRDFQNAAQALFDSCKNLIGATAGYTAVLSKDGTANEVLFLDSGGRACAVDPSLPMPIRGLRAEAYGTGKAVYHNDFTKSEWVQYMPEGHVTLDNVLFAPLTIKGKVVGLFGLANKPGGFTENDARVASAFGELAAIALHDSQMLQSLENSEERFRSVAQTASDGIITTDSRGNIVFWNPAAETIFGHSADEAVGQPLTLIMPERFHQAHQDGMKQVISTGESNVIGKRVEVVGLRKDGTEFPLELSLTTWKTGEGVFFTGIVRDITERKRAEEAVKESEKKYRDLVDNALVGVFSTNRNGRVLYVNEASLQMFEFDSPEELRACGAIRHYKNPKDRLAFLKALKKSRNVNNYELELLTKTGKTKNVLVSATLNGDVISGMVMDITERKQAEEALRKSEEKYRLVI
ncbi:MAG: PAS domain S-box protein, partial [bacterium]